MPKTQAIPDKRVADLVRRRGELNRQVKELGRQIDAAQDARALAMLETRDAGGSRGRVASLEAKRQAAFEELGLIRRALYLAGKR